MNLNQESYQKARTLTGLSMDEVLTHMQAALDANAYSEVNVAGFPMTDISPAHTIERLTEIFGLNGLGWGLDYDEVGIGVTDKNWWMATMDRAIFWYVLDIGGESLKLTIPCNGSSTNKDRGYAVRGAITSATKAGASRLLFQLDIYKGEGVPEVSFDQVNQALPGCNKHGRAMDWAGDFWKCNGKGCTSISFAPAPDDPISDVYWDLVRYAAERGWDLINPTTESGFTQALVGAQVKLREMPSQHLLALKAYVYYTRVEESFAKYKMPKAVAKLNVPDARRAIGKRIVATAIDQDITFWEAEGMVSKAIDTNELIVVSKKTDQGTELVVVAKDELGEQ